MIKVVLETWGDALSPALRNRGFGAIRQIAARKAREEAARLAAEEAAKRAIQKRLQTPCRDLIRATLKRSKSYDSSLENKTLEQLLKDPSQAAQKMLKLIEEEVRLMNKNL